MTRLSGVGVAAMAEGLDSKTPSKRPQGHPRKRKEGRKTAAKDARQFESVAELIDRLLLVPVKMTTEGGTQTITSLEAIMHQLAQSAFDGNIRAKRALLLYREFARKNTDRKPRVTFVETDYTRAVAEAPKV